MSDSSAAARVYSVTERFPSFRYNLAARCTCIQYVRRRPSEMLLLLFFYRTTNLLDRAATAHQMHS